MTSTEEEKDPEGARRLQELYLHLDHTFSGDRHMAYYGQLRAEGLGHDAALEKTVVHFRLRDLSWYRKRLGEGT